MNKTELVLSIQGKLGEGATKKCAEAALSAVLDSIAAAVKKGEKVQLIGFGTFEVKKRAARTGHNPRTKEKIQIAASRTLTFKPSSIFKVKEAPKKTSKKK